MDGRALTSTGAPSDGDSKGKYGFLSEWGGGRAFSQLRRNEWGMVAWKSPPCLRSPQVESGGCDQRKSCLLPSKDAFRERGVRVAARGRGELT